MAENPNPNRARDHLANERTFLAWVRTGMASGGVRLCHWTLRHRDAAVDRD